MLRQEYLDRLVDNSHVELYLSASGGASGRMYWPWKMNPPKEALPRLRDTCGKYIIDSDPLDDSVTTSDVLDTATKLNADIASLQDVYLDKEKTVDSLLKGLEIADNHPFQGKLLLPLQEPYVECWQEIGKPKNHLLGIGGLKDASPTKRLHVTKRLRDAVGEDTWIHGFGWGVQGLATHIRSNPDLIDSLDYSTPIQNAMQNVQCSPGDEVSSVLAMDMATQLVRDLREVTTHPDENTPKSLRQDCERGLEEWV